MDADVQFDVAELDEERLGLSRDDAQRSQARDGEGRKILAVCPYHIKLDSTLRCRRKKCQPAAAHGLQNWELLLGRWGAVPAPNGDGH
jgi:hypothetical protein